LECLDRDRNIEFPDIALDHIRLLQAV
jgi:hypothetical protein